MHLRFVVSASVVVFSLTAIHAFQAGFGRYAAKKENPAPSMPRDGRIVDVADKHPILHVIYDDVATALRRVGLSGTARYLGRWTSRTCRMDINYFCLRNELLTDPSPNV